MMESKGVHTPLVSLAILKLDDGPPPTDCKIYGQLIGSLQYLSIARPDITFAVNHLSQVMCKPSYQQLKAAKKVLNYLEGTNHLCLLIHL